MVKGWFGEPGRHAMAARGVKTVSPEFARFVHNVRTGFHREKLSILRQVKDALPGIDIMDIKLSGSYVRGTPTEESDIDILVTYRGRLEPNEVWERLSGRIWSAYGGVYDIHVERV